MELHNLAQYRRAASPLLSVFLSSSSLPSPLPFSHAIGAAGESRGVASDFFSHLFSLSQYYTIYEEMLCASWHNDNLNLSKPSQE